MCDLEEISCNKMHGGLHPAISGVALGKPFNPSVPGASFWNEDNNTTYSTGPL